MKNVVRVLGLAMLLAFVSTAVGAPPPLHPGKRVALVLGGGGALGFAELGAIEWLEQHHIPVDYLFGTSAGSIIGGWYATGGNLYPQGLNIWPPEKIVPERQLYLQAIRPTLAAIDWDQISAGSPPFDDLTVRRKWELREYPSLLQLEMVPRLLPEKTRGLTPRNELGLLFDGLTSKFPINELHNGSEDGYDNLPIPFRANASVVTGSYDDFGSYREYVFGDSVQAGAAASLGRAIRASSAIPWVFTPVRFAGQILVDGGYTDNLAVDLSAQQKSWQPEVTIALDVFPLGQAPQSPNLVYVPLLQRRFSPFSYRDWDTVAFAGYQMMEQVYHSPDGVRLRALMLDRPDWETYERNKASVAARLLHGQPDLKVASIRTADPMVRSTAAHLQSELGSRPFDSSARQALGQEIDKTLGAQRLDSIGYYLEQTPGQTDSADLVLSATPKSYGPPFFLRGISFSDATHQPTEFSLTQRSISPLGESPTSELTTDLSLGTQNEARIGLHWQPGGILFTEPAGFFQRSAPDLTPIIAGDSSLSFARLGGELAVGISPGPHDEAKIGLTAGRLYSGTYAADQGGFAMGQASYSHDTENFVVAPSAGGRVSLDASWHLQSPAMSRQFPQLKGEAEQFITLMKSSVLFGRAAGGSSFGYSAPQPDQFSLGGFGGLSILRPGAMSGDFFTYGTLGVRQRLLNLPYLAGVVYGSVQFESGSVTDQAGPTWHAQDFAIRFLADTRLGPFWIGSSFDEDRMPSFQVGFGSF